MLKSTYVATLLAVITLPSWAQTPLAPPEVVLACQDFTKQPTGSWQASAAAKLVYIGGNSINVRKLNLVQNGPRIEGVDMWSAVESKCGKKQ